MIVFHPDSHIDINLQVIRCTVATHNRIRLGWLLGADWTRGQGQHVIRLDGDDYPTRHDPQYVTLHITDSD